MDTYYYKVTLYGKDQWNCNEQVHVIKKDNLGYRLDKLYYKCSNNDWSSLNLEPIYYPIKDAIFNQWPYNNVFKIQAVTPITQEEAFVMML